MIVTLTIRAFASILYNEEISITCMRLHFQKAA
nr:MAG TPA: hypothetical protein [Herelleviridae sp.]